MSGLRAFLAPDTFELAGQEALMYVPEPDDGQRELVVRAAKACPVQAILLDEVPEPDASARRSD